MIKPYDLKEGANMYKSLLCLIILFLMVGCGGQKPGPTKVRAEKDPKVAAVEEKISKTTAEGKQMVEKALAMKPEVNDQVSAKTLGDILKDYSENKGTFNITPLGWESTQKRNGRWKLVYHYQDYQKQLMSAEWEYNPQTNKLYPFELVNAPSFWTGIGDEKDAQAKGDQSKKDKR
jgi:hypothetical protein